MCLVFNSFVFCYRIMHKKNNFNKVNKAQNRLRIITIKLMMQNNIRSERKYHLRLKNNQRKK